MIEEEREEHGDYDEFEVKHWGDQPIKPANWDHEPKRGKKSKTDKSSEVNLDNEQKRRQKIQDKILKKVVQETDQNVPKGPIVTNQVVKVDREVEAICNILKYMLGEYCLDGTPEYANEERTIEKWELEQIMKQVRDTNLGDFIIKCPNPDNLPDTWVDKYEVKETDGQLNSPHKYTRIQQAMDFFYDLFEVETYSQKESERQTIAFIIGFFFLKYKSNFDETGDEAADSFLKVYDYFKLVQSMSLKDYMQLRQQEMFYEKHEYIIQELFPEEYTSLSCFNQKISVVDQHEEMWKNLIKMIYINLNDELLSDFGDEKQPEKEECRFIFGKVKSISELLKTFPDLMGRVLAKMKYFDEHKEELQKEQEEEEERKEQAKKKEQQQIDKGGKVTEVRIEEQVPKGPPKDRGKRLLFWGQYLKKTIVGENVIWVNTKSRPNDVATLLRFSLIYKLAIKSRLMLRCFLHTDQTHLVLVMKTSQQILENYAQKYKLNMQIDLGASDLFSFEPVDQYMRPMRLHRYVTDKQFLQKYKIKPGQGGDSQDPKQLQSIESEAVNIYKKVQVMNEDELRTLVILDQIEANALLKYIGHKRLNIDYIEQHPLDNDYNKDNTDRDDWELFYVYNKLIIAFIKRIKALYTVSRKEHAYYQELQGNLGMLLRLMFLKALDMCNQMYYEHREIRSIIPRVVSNLWCTRNKLKTIWDYMQIDSPSGFHQYYKIDKLERLWRKYEVNELKHRSKFFPAERLIITNRVVLEIVNISSGLDKKHIIDFFPLHDPYFLKSIQVEPYLMVIKRLQKTPKKGGENLDGASIGRLYSQYESKSTMGDFTKMSVQKQLEFHFTQFKTFQTASIRAYCGQKIAFYFTLIKFLALKAWPLILPAFIFQCLLWAQNQDLLKRNSSSLTGFNNFLIVVWIFVNLFWTTDMIQSWKHQERKLAQQYGVTKLQENQMRRVKFEGAFKRDFQTDQLNFEYVPYWEVALKAFFTFVLNLAYVVLVVEVLLLLVLFKTYLYQSGFSASMVNTVPAIMIAVATQIFTKIYTIIIHSITNFQNHKTVTQYEGSLVVKSALITFIINFFSIFIYAFFSGYLASSFICQITTTQTLERVSNCDYFLSGLLLSMIMVDFATTIIGAFTPYLIFKLKEWLKNRQITKTSKFNGSFYESIDRFYEEQDRMDSYMYTEQLDSSWLGYMNIVSVFAATALFAPAFPFSYTMMFLTGIVRLHASKYDVIYLKKRILPTKTNSINWWMNIIEIIAYVSIVTNVGYMIYTREVFKDDEAKLFFLFIIICFGVKFFILAQYSSLTDVMAKRNDLKVSDILKNRRRDQFDNIPEDLNTDIENVIYDETKLNRKFHNVAEANIKEKDV